MSSSDLAISAHGLSKTYRIKPTIDRRAVATERFLSRLPLGSPREEVRALRDVTFDVERSEVVGIIGRNGAGKSTLLKVLSRITKPDAGHADLYGRVGSLLEVGTGFHPELTGRENIFLNGAILGMRRREIIRRFDDIVEFAGVERFLETPVKRYSSGMYVRLAFAVAAHLEPEIMIVDEVLAVGDAEFQRKCLGKMSEVSQEHGRTILFVSHNMAAIEALCGRTMHIEEGRIQYDGDTGEAIDSYLARAAQNDDSDLQRGAFDLSTRDRKLSDGQEILQRVTLEADGGLPTDTLRMGQGLSIVVDLVGFEAVPGRHLGIRIKSELDQVLLTASTRMRPLPPPRPPRSKEQVVCRIPHLPLTPGRYWIDLNIKDRLNTMIDMVERAAALHVLESDVYGTGHQVTHASGVIFVDFTWEFRDA